MGEGTYKFRDHGSIFGSGVKRVATAGMGFMTFDERFVYASKNISPQFSPGT